MRAFLKTADGVRLETVANLAGTTPATVSRIVNGERTGRPDTVVRIASAFTSLGCSVDAGRILTEPAKSPDEEPDPALAPTG